MFATTLALISLVKGVSQSREIDQSRRHSAHSNRKLSFELSVMVLGPVSLLRGFHLFMHRRDCM